jgi:hypothetical protein
VLDAGFGLLIANLQTALAILPGARSGILCEKQTESHILLFGFSTD